MMMMAMSTYITKFEKRKNPRLDRTDLPIDGNSRNSSTR
jgi:hypothetical protein